MRTLLSTTALVVTLGLPTLTFAQATPPPANPGIQQQNEQMSGFLSQRDQSDLFVSDLMGHDVYARRTQQDATRSDGQASTGQATSGQSTDQTTTGQATDDQATTEQAATDQATEAQETEGQVGGLGADAYSASNSDGSNNMHLMNRADLDDMDNIGQINEIVLSSDGRVRALVIGVGGFLGIGEQDVAVTMDQITFAFDGEDQSQMYIVVNTGADMLRESPAYDRTSMAADRTQDGDRTQAGAGAQTGAGTQAGAGSTDRSAFTAPEMQRDGYDRVAATDVTTEMLTGTSVYDVNDNDVGTVTDMILDDAGGITQVIIDFGGFLGIGVSQVALNFDELTILSDEGYANVRLYVDATKEQIQDLPQYQSAN